DVVQHLGRSQLRSPTKETVYLLIGRVSGGAGVGRLTRVVPKGLTGLGRQVVHIAVPVVPTVGDGVVGIGERACTTLEFGGSDLVSRFGPQPLPHVVGHVGPVGVPAAGGVPAERRVGPGTRL